jgi:Rrf2 family protein
MRFSKSTELAIHSLWQLAVKQPELLFVSEMAGKQHVSESYLAKVFQKLARKGLVRSTRGKHGGFKLAREPNEISMAEVVRAVESDKSYYDCQDKNRCCGGRSDCPVRQAFHEAEKRMFGVLENTSLADLVRRARSEARRAWMV